jgi:hypothetical protein
VSSAGFSTPASPDQGCISWADSPRAWTTGRAHARLRCGARIGDTRRSAPARKGFGIGTRCQVSGIREKVYSETIRRKRYHRSRRNLTLRTTSPQYQEAD